LAGFEGRLADDFALGLEGFLGAVFAVAFLAGFTDLAFKCLGLARALAGFAAFFALGSWALFRAFRLARKCERMGGGNGHTNWIEMETCDGEAAGGV